MPKKGYQSITLKDDVIKLIDSVVDKKNPSKKSRQIVISIAVGKMLKNGEGP
jgi:hypothetical protein